MASDAKILMFDEPTSSLTEEDAGHLFAVIRDLKAAGMGIVYISHFLEEVTQIGDVYTVLRDGRSVAEGRLADVTLADIVASDGRPRNRRAISARSARADRRSWRPVGFPGDPSPQEVSLTLHRGEIFGLAGLVGAGRSELVRLHFRA